MREASILVAAALAGCGGRDGVPETAAPAPGFEEARAFQDCAPWDGPAITIVLAAAPALLDSVPYPHVRLSLYGTPEALFEKSVSWGPDELNRGSAIHCTGPETCRIPREARVRLGPLGQGIVPGVAVLKFADGGVFRGGFRAPLDSTPAMCG